MKKIANFLVDKRYIVLALFLIIAVISGIMMTKVNVNYDMTKYLPDNSDMKIGMDVMEDEFEVLDSSVLKVMFKNLSDDEKITIHDELTGFKYVDSVDYDSESSDYNKDNNTLYILNTSYDSYADETKELYNAVNDKYSENYDMYTSGSIRSSNTDALPWWIMALAIVIAMVILFIMCESWIEPILFIVTLGIAVVINMGTNALLPSVSNTTHSIVAILQLVLSMDYSIILLNRYRQEKAINPDKIGAMKLALVNSFAAITSSSITTFVGLLSLVFMSFKIGADMGVALAKGVLISLICIFTILPAFIIMFDKTIDKLHKRGLNVKMNAVGRFEHKLRYIIAGVFVLFFIGTYFWKGTTDITFPQEFTNEVDEIFIPENTIVMLYENKDEDKLSPIIEKLENNTEVKSVMGYVNTLGKEYTSDELADVLSKMDMGETEIDMDSSMLSLVYYNYYNKDETIKIPLNELVKFIGELSSNEMFAKQIPSDTTEQIKMLAMYTDVKAVTTEHSSAELAEIFDMESTMIDQLFMMSGVQTMSIQNFLNFVVENLSGDTQTAMEIPAETAEQIQMLAMFTDIDTVTSERSSAELAQIIGMDNAMIDQLFMMSGVQTMSIQNFLNFMVTNVLTDPQMSLQISAEQATQIGTLAMFTDIDTITAERSSTELAQLMGIDNTMVEQLFKISGVQTMSIQNFISLLSAYTSGEQQMGAQISEESIAQLQMLQGIVNTVVEGKEFTSEEFIQAFGGSMGDIDENTIDLLYLYYAAQNNSDKEWTLSIENMFNYINSDIVTDERFASFFDDELKNSLKNSADELNDGITQLKGKNYSRLIITSTYPEDTDETRAFLKDLKENADKLDGNYYLIGNSAMDYEMSEIFGDELNKITLITAIAIFITVVVTFRSFAVPLVLVLLIQSGVYATMGVIGAQGYSIHYLALLIVQSILMGATIDYAILYTSYYKEHRVNMPVKEALIEAYNGSMHTILTSGTILVVVTFILQFAFADPTIGQIVQTISIGSLIAIILILFLLPAVLATMDKFVSKNRFKDEVK